MRRPCRERVGEEPNEVREPLGRGGRSGWGPRTGEVAQGRRYFPGRRRGHEAGLGRARMEMSGTSLRRDVDRVRKRHSRRDRGKWRREFFRQPGQACHHGLVASSELPAHAVAPLTNAHA